MTFLDKNDQKKKILEIDRIFSDCISRLRGIRKKKMAVMADKREEEDLLKINAIKQGIDNL